jgi:hypothetical protein
MDNREDYGYGWNPKGRRFHDLKSEKRSIRVSIMSGLYQGNRQSSGGINQCGPGRYVPSAELPG